MRGRKPKPTNVIPLTGDGAALDAQRERNVAAAMAKLRPKGLSPDLRKEWDRVAKLLADPTVDRLKARFVDVITEYCRAIIRLRTLREAMPAINQEIYRVEAGRNGTQIKQHPFVAQINETWRQWRSMIAMLGLSPADERNLIPGQGDLFDAADQYF
jgi:P27 family predicted phage terminase small subunit